MDQRGGSGSDKSILLRAPEYDIRHDIDWTCVNMAEIKPIEGKPIVETVGSRFDAYTIFPSQSTM
jgi:hypothetical protein